MNDFVAILRGVLLPLVMAAAGGLLGVGVWAGSPTAALCGGLMLSCGLLGAVALEVQGE